MYSGSGKNVFIYEKQPKIVISWSSGSYQVLCTEAGWVADAFEKTVITKHFIISILLPSVVMQPCFLLILPGKDYLPLSLCEMHCDPRGSFKSLLPC
jgi:hypothetical protein